MISIKGLFKKDNPFDYIVLGLIIKEFGNLAQLFIHYHISDALFGAISWLLILRGIYLIPGKLRFPFKGGYKFLVKFFLLLCGIMIVRGYTDNEGYAWFTTIGAINYHLFMPTYILCYLIPFTALIPIRYYNFRLFVSYSVIFIIVTICSFVIYYPEIIRTSMMEAAGITLENAISASTLSYCTAFTFLTLLYLYLPQKKWSLNVIGLITCLLLMVIGGRRGGTLLNTIMLVGALYFYSDVRKGFSKFLTRSVLLIALVISVAIIFRSDMSSYIIERGMEDTRSSVEEALLDQMNQFDLIFGKGLNGRYYCPLKEDDYLNGWRYGIETGFYNLVLKGGYLLAFTYIIILAIPAYQGLFRSHNAFCKAGGYYMVWHLISLKPFGILTFDLRFFFLWVFIVCCMNKTVRRMSDEEISRQFFYNLK